MTQRPDADILASSYRTSQVKMRNFQHYFTQKIFGYRTHGEVTQRLYANMLAYCYTTCQVKMLNFQHYFAHIKRYTLIGHESK